MPLRAPTLSRPTRRGPVAMAVIAALIAAPLALAPASFAAADDAVAPVESTVVEPTPVEQAPVEAAPAEPAPALAEPAPAESVEPTPAAAPEEAPVEEPAELLPAEEPSEEEAPEEAPTVAPQRAVLAAPPAQPTELMGNWVDGSLEVSFRTASLSEYSVFVTADGVTQSSSLGEHDADLVLTRTFAVDPGNQYQVLVIASGAGLEAETEVIVEPFWSYGTGQPFNIDVFRAAAGNSPETFGVSFDKPQGTGQVMAKIVLPDGSVQVIRISGNSPEHFDFGQAGDYLVSLAGVRGYTVGRYSAPISYNTLSGETVGIPGIPTSLTAVGSDQTLTLTWAEPVSGAAVDHYEVEYLDRYNEWARVAGTSSPAVITGLVNGNPVDFRIRAYSATNPGRWAVGQGTPRGNPPTTVVGLTATAGNERVSLSWQAPADPGSTPIVFYEVESERNGSWTNLYNVSDLAIDDLYLNNGETFSYRVRAYNGNDSGPWATVSGTPAAVPEAPAVSALGREGSLLVSWTDGESYGHPVHGYELSYLDDSGVWTAAEPATSPTVIPNLTNGFETQLRVRALSSEGVGAWGLGFGTPSTPIGAPGLSVAPSDNLIVVSMSPPLESGPSGLFAYEVERRVAPDGDWASITRTYYLFPTVYDYVDNHIGYQYRARSVDGNNEASDWTLSDVAVAGRAPGEPVPRFVYADGTSITAYWYQPGDVGSGIHGYDVQYRAFGDTAWSDGGRAAASPYVITGLQAATDYEVRVRATNIAAAGEWMQYSYTATTLALLVAPVSLTATPGDGSVDLAWTTAGATDDQNHRIEYRADGGTWEALLNVSGTSWTVDGLTNGTSYEFRVRGYHADVDGPWTTTAAVVPASVAAAPSVPNGFTATGQLFGVRLTWTAPADPGSSAVTGYEYSVKLSAQDDSAWSVPTAAASGGIFSTMTNIGVSHDFRVRAINAAGAGAWSAVASGTPQTFIIVFPTAPGAPTGLLLTAGDTTATAAWTAAAGTVTGYTVVVTAPGETTQSLSTPTPGILVSGLKNSVTYTVTVSAQNFWGSGPAVSDQVTPYVFAPVFTLADGSSATGKTLKPGDTVTISGAGALPLHSVIAELHSTPISLGSALVAGDGSFSFSVTIPANAPAGNHSLVVFLAGDTSTVAQAAIAVVIAAAAVVPAAVPGGLVRTGIDPAPAVTLALALMVLGGLAIAARARRRAA